MANYAPDRSDNNFSPFANKLIQSGHVSADQMQQALMESRRSGRTLREILELMNAVPTQLLQEYQQQLQQELKQLSGVEVLEAAQVAKINISRVKELIDSIVPIDICRREGLIPLEKRDSPPSILIAMVDPNNSEALGDLHRILQPLRLGMERIAITPEDYEQLICHYAEPEVDKGTEILLPSSSQTVTDEYLDIERAIKQSDRPQVDKAVNRILLLSLTEKASEIHILPQSDGLRIRLGKQGAMRSAMSALPKQIIPDLIAQFKLSAQLDISQQSIPQTGRIRRSFRRKKFDFHVNIMPSDYGERVLLRIFDCSTCHLSLEHSLTDPDSCSSVRSLASHSAGLILLTSTTGSSKSAFIYNLLREKQQQGLKIFTIEEAIACVIPGVQQIEMRPELGINFASIWQQVVREEPDIIFVDRIPDRDAAQTAIAASANRLVLISLATADTASAIAHLVAQGIDREIIFTLDSLLGGIHHGLVRRVCPACRIPYTPSKQQINRFGLSASSDLTFYRAKSLPRAEISAAKGRGELCRVCQGSGYTTMASIYQVLPVDRQISALISQGATASEINQVAADAGMKTLLDYSLDLVRQGQTTLEEVKRVLGNDTLLAGLRLIKIRQSRRRSDDALQQSHAELEQQVKVLQQSKAELEQQIERLQQSHAELEQHVKSLQTKQVVVRTQVAQDRFLSRDDNTETYSHLGEWEKNELIKRLKHQEKEGEQRVKVEIVLKLLAELELFELAKAQIPIQTKGEAAIQNSYQLIYHRLLGVLQEIGVEAIKTKGQIFDANLHEVVMTQSTDEYPQGTIIAEIRPGYKLGDRVLRPAQVKVAAPENLIL
ncbi:MAG: nucleotide exchange factor GrpE [Hormoscilla sp.]